MKLLQNHDGTDHSLPAIHIAQILNTNQPASQNFGLSQYQDSVD
jgi:hypothetical protein